MYELIESAANNWLLIAFIAPAFWALVNIFDVYFVGGVYRDEVDGAIVSGVFQLVPLLVILFVAGGKVPEFAKEIYSGAAAPAFLFSLAGGIFFASSFYFYFRSLFRKNDASMVQVLWTLTVVTVPILAYIMFGQLLPAQSYAGLLLVMGGAMSLAFDSKIRKIFAAGFLKSMAAAIILMSLSMVFDEHAYGLLGGMFGLAGFWIGFFGFCLGAFLVGVAFLVFSRRHLGNLVRKYWKIFLMIEGINFLGNMTSQRALDISPSPSYVAAIETFASVFVVIYGLAIVFVLSILAPNKNDLAKKIYSEQIGNVPAKVIATLMMAAGVYLIH